MSPKYEQVKVQLSGLDGNAFSIIGRVRREMRTAGIPSEEIEQFSTEAMGTGSYDELLQHVMRTVNTA